MVSAPARRIRCDFGDFVWWLEQSCADVYNLFEPDVVVTHVVIQ